MPLPNLFDGISLFNSGDREAAKRVFAAIVESKPENSSAWYWLAACTDDSAQQQTYLKRSLTANPNNKSAKEALAKLDPEFVNNLAETARSASAMTAVTDQPGGSSSETNGDQVAESELDRLLQTPPRDPGNEIDQLLQDLTNAEVQFRLQAVNKLGNIPSSYQRVVDALIKVIDDDPNWQVTTAALRVLQLPVHQKIIQNDPKSRFRYESPVVERHGCIYIYVVLLLLSAVSSAYMLWAFVSYSPNSGRLNFGRELLSTIGSVPNTVYPQGVVGELDGYFISMMRGAYLASLAWGLLLAIGLWRMQKWARWLMIGSSALSIVVSLIAIVIAVVASLVSTSSNNNDLSFVLLLASLFINSFSLVWFIQHKHWRSE